MRFQGDKDASPEWPDPGLPRAESGHDVPRWLVVLGAVAGFTLLVALVRYAIDLLGVVFVIILVGFAIRALSDWLTEGEAVSGWAMSALTMGLTGTVLVGLWLVNSGEIGGNRLEQRLPGPVQQTVSWLEARGWGQRVLLPGRSDLTSESGGGLPGGPTATSGGAGSQDAPEPYSAPVSMAQPRSVPAVPAAGSTPKSRKPVSRQQPGEAAAAPRADGSRPAGPPSTTVPARMPTRLGLSAPASSIVGRSVRLVATLQADGDRAPTGRVAFLASGVELGRVTVRQGTAILVTLSLELGEHQLSASYEGDEWHLPSTSASVAHTVRRQ